MTIDIHGQVCKTEHGCHTVEIRVCFHPFDSLYVEFKMEPLCDFLFRVRLRWRVFAPLLDCRHKSRNHIGNLEFEQGFYGILSKVVSSCLKARKVVSSCLKTRRAFAFRFAFQMQTVFHGDHERVALPPQLGLIRRYCMASHRLHRRLRAEIGIFSISLRFRLSIHGCLGVYNCSCTRVNFQAEYWEEYFQWLCFWRALHPATRTFDCYWYLRSAFPGDLLGFLS